MAASIAKIKLLLETIAIVAIRLTDSEISDISKVIYRSLERMEKEDKESVEYGNK